MYTHHHHQDSDAAASESSDPAESDWYGLYDGLDVPDSLGAWTLKDFADILQNVEVSY